MVTGSLVVFTWAPGGGVNVKLDIAGRARSSDVKPTWKAGLAEPRAKTWTLSGRSVWASTAIRIFPISD